LADSLYAQWMAVHVESSKNFRRGPGRLTKNLALARELGAEVIATVDEDLCMVCCAWTRQHNATQIVVGKPEGASLRQKISSGRFLRRLVADSGDIESTSSVLINRMLTGNLRPSFANGNSTETMPWSQLISGRSDGFKRVFCELIGYRAVGLIIY